MIYNYDWTSFATLALLFAVASVLDARACGVTDIRGFARWASAPRKSPHALAFLQALLISFVLSVVSSLITLALMPKPKPPEPGKADIPDVKEGATPVEIFGAVWRTESFLAGWKQLDPPEPIKEKAGKK